MIRVDSLKPLRSLLVHRCDILGSVKVWVTMQIPIPVVPSAKAGNLQDVL
jgi:hypothetical protein